MHTGRRFILFEGCAPEDSQVDSGARLASKKGTVMSVVWIIALSALAVVWAISFVDVFRRHYSGATTVG
jgi:hypothetical protein